ncbi:MAG TPA: YceI family protein [Acidimicrobiia bacterium]|nr:YceI family protein [Acidimicrobiia bacterium]
MRRFKWVIALPIAILVLATAGTWTYIHVLSDKAPAPLTLGGELGTNPPAAVADGAVSGTGTDRSAAPVTAAPDSFDGTWIATTGSQAGYRAKEVLFGQSTEAVGRTGNVDGALTIEGTTVRTADISIDLASVESDKSQRDSQFRGRIMSVTKYPTATFKLTQPIDMGSIPADGATVSFPATGELAVHGVTRTVTTTVTAQRTGGTIRVNGSIPVVFADYGIPDPSFGPASVEDHGTIEFLVSFVKSAHQE